MRFQITILMCLATAACVIEHKSQGKFANAFVRSMRIAARNSDAYIKKVIKTTQQAVMQGDVSQLKTLFSGQDSSTAIKAYRDFVSENFQTSKSIGTVLDILISQNPGKHPNFTSGYNRMLLGFSKSIDEAVTTLDVHIKLMREKHNDLHKLIDVNFNTQELEKIAQQWRKVEHTSMRLNALKIDYLSYQIRVIRQLKSGVSWEIGAHHTNKILASLTPEQRKVIDKGKIWSSENLQNAVLKRLATIEEINDPATTLRAKPATPLTISEETILRKEIQQLLEIDDKFLQQLE